MRLDRLEIGGFLHFEKPAVVDLTAVPVGLVAITGPNGHGKTRLLDAGLGSVYGPGAQTQAFPSRDGTLAEYATSRDAYIETQWDMDGDVYRIRVNVDGVKRNTDAVLLKAWRTMLGDQQFSPLNDGKTSTFKEEVAKLFPSRRQVLASAFAAQGRQGSFVSLDNKGKMELFSEMLALGHYAGKADTAKRCVAAVERARAALLAVRASLEREAEADADVDGRLATMRSNLAAASIEATSGRDAVVRAQAERDVQAEALQQQLVTEERLRALEASLKANENEVKRLDATLLSLDGRGSGALLRFHSAVEQIAQRALATEQVIAQREAIRAAVNQKQDVERSLIEARTQEKEARAALWDAKTRSDYAQKCVTFVETVTRDLAAAREQAAMVKTVPCGGAGTYAACKFLRSAAMAQEKIPALELAAGPWEELTEQAADVGQQVDAAEEVVLSASAHVQELEVKLAANVLAALGSQLDVAEAQLDACERERKAVDAAHLEQLADLAEEKVRAQAARQAADAVRSDLAGKLPAARQGAGQAAVCKASLEAANVRLAACNQAVEAFSATVARLEAGVEELTRRQAVRTGRLERLADVQARLEVASGELVGWQLLVRACGRDGLPRLEVDAAGPTVSSLCNDLLSSCYGTRFTVEVVTQVARADGKGLKEQFDLSVFDNQYGGEPRSISDLSGGERVVVEEALRGAIALFVNSQNVHPIRTCWRDETTGALDPANVPRYVAMLRRIQQLGGFAHVLFVTHNEEAAALADVQVRVEDGQPTVVLPPYREAA